MKTLIASIALLIAFTLASLSAQAQTYKLTINIKNLLQRTGTLRVGLVTKAENFMGKSEIDTAVTVPAEGPLTIVFPNLAPGTYAVRLYQDLNGNKTLDRQNGMPTEPFGFSNLPMLMGPPSFEAAAFALNEDTEIRVNLIAL